MRRLRKRVIQKVTLPSDTFWTFWHLLNIFFNIFLNPLQQCWNSVVMPGTHTCFLWGRGSSTSWLYFKSNSQVYLSRLLCSPGFQGSLCSFWALHSNSVSPATGLSFPIKPIPPGFPYSCHHPSLYASSFYFILKKCGIYLRSMMIKEWYDYYSQANLHIISSCMLPFFGCRMTAPEIYSFSKFPIFSKYSFQRFIYLSESERAQEGGKQAQGEASSALSREPHAGLHRRTLGYWLEPKADV